MSAYSAMFKPSEIRFTQDSIKDRFRNGLTCDDVIDNVKGLHISVDDLPRIKVASLDGKQYSANNRRLYVLRVLECEGCIRDAIRVDMIPFSRTRHRFSTKNDGTSVRIRGRSDVRPHSIEEINAGMKQRGMHFKGTGPGLRYIPLMPHQVSLLDSDDVSSDDESIGWEPGVVTQWSAASPQPVFNAQYSATRDVENRREDGGGVGFWTAALGAGALAVGGLLAASAATANPRRERQEAEERRRNESNKSEECSIQ